MAVKFTNNAKTTLASGITNSATTATVADGSVFPSLGAGEYFYITFDDGSNNEIAKVTARSSNTLTIVRAQDSTSARAFSADDSAELRVISALLTEIQENIAAKSANQTVYSATAASSATAYNIGVDPGVEANASVFLDGVYQNHDTFSFSGSTLTFDAAPTNGTKIEVVVDNLVNLQSSNLTVDTFTASSSQTAFTLSDSPAAEENLLVFIDGVFQNQAAYTISNNVLTVDTAVTDGRTVTIYTINPVNIGTPSDSTVTSAKLTGNITLPGALTVGAYDVAFDSPTFVVDNANSRVGIGTATPSTGALDVVGEVHISSHLDLPDSAIIKLGTGDDIQMYHDTGNNYISVGAGKGNFFIEADQFYFRNGARTKYFATFITDGGINLYFNNAKKLETVTGGINITGDTDTDTLTVSGITTFNSNVNFNGSTSSYPRLSRSGTSIQVELADASDWGNFKTGGLTTYAASVFNENSADVDFRVESNNNANMLFVDGGNDRVGIGLSPAEALDVSGTIQTTVGLKVATHPVIGYASFDSGYATRLGSTGTSTLNATQIYAGGNVQATFKGGFTGLNETLPKKALHITRGDSDLVVILDQNNVVNDQQICFAHDYGDGSTTGGNYWGIGVDGSENELVIAYDANSQASVSGDRLVTFTPTGKVGIGTNTPGEKLEVNGNIKIPTGSKILAGSGASAAATINAYTTTVSSGLFSAFRAIDNNSASSYWDIGASGGTNTLLNFYHNAVTTPKISFKHDGGATFAGTATVDKLALAVGGGVNGLGPLSISTTATNITAANDFGSLVIVAGNSGGNMFSDLVFYATTVGATVVAGGSVSGSPAGRTYTVVSSILKLAMASGTYSVSATTLQGTL